MCPHVAKSVSTLQKHNNYASLSDVFTLRLYAILPYIINLSRNSKIVFPVPVIYPKILGRPAHGLVTLSTGLSQLCDGNIKENTVAGEWKKTNKEVLYDSLGQGSVADIVTGYRLGSLRFEPGSGEVILSSPHASRLTLGTTQPLPQRVTVLFPAE
jgi:hypothetical protein